MVRTRYRASQVIIDTPNASVPILINVSVQKVDEEDGVVINEYPRMEYIHRIAGNIATEVVTIFDPVLGKEIMISVAGLHMGIQQCVCNWLLEEHDECVQEGEFVWVT